MNRENVSAINPRCAEVIIHDERSIGGCIAIYTGNGELLAKQAPPEKKQSIGDELKRHFESSMMDKQPCRQCGRVNEVEIVVRIPKTPDPMESKHYFCSWFCLSFWARNMLEGKVPTTGYAGYTAPQLSAYDQAGNPIHPKA